MSGDDYCTFLSMRHAIHSFATFEKLFGYDGEVEVTVCPARLGIPHATVFRAEDVCGSFPQRVLARWAKLDTLDSW